MTVVIFKNKVKLGAQLDGTDYTKVGDLAGNKPADQKRGFSGFDVKGCRDKSV